MIVDLSVGFIEETISLVNEYKIFNELNSYLKMKTGILNFFNSIEDLNQFKQFLINFKASKEVKRDMGDFQTPIHLVDIICQYLSAIGFNPNILIEPTCGIGNFVISALKFLPSIENFYCIELQKKYEWYFKLAILKFSLKKKRNINIEFYNDSIFTHRFSRRLSGLLKRKDNVLLILGNPPWVTNTELSILDSKNVPLKSNIKGHKGIEAMTGRGNFDIAENIILQIAKRFSTFKGKIAMLCKTSVIRNIVKDLDKFNIQLSDMKTLIINAKKEFNINADAALFLADLGENKHDYCQVSSLYDPSNLQKIYGWKNNKFVSNMATYDKFQFLDGVSPKVWRHGVKHDATKVMVLKIDSDGTLSNGFSEIVTIEDDPLYPFVKSSDLKNLVIKKVDKRVILTQKSLQEKTDKLALNYPKLWNYLIKHSEDLDRRKSIIYKNRPRFSIFGIGDYTFKPYKVAISGLYKKPNFSLLFPIHKKPIIPDDTCYYLSFNNFMDAFYTWILLNTSEIKKFLSSIVFLDSKRPYTKEKLMRINYLNLRKILSFSDILKHYQKGLKDFIEIDVIERDFLDFIKRNKTVKLKSLTQYLK